jgi:hypothetical protein
MSNLTRLLGAFSPREWAEQAYVSSPPFATETAFGRTSLIPRDADAEAALDGLGRAIGLKKRRQGHVSYLVSRADAVRALRQFDWIVRRSWRSADLSALWALVHLGETGGWERQGTTVEAVAEAAGLGPKECGEALARIFHARVESIRGDGLGDYASDRRLLVGILESHVSELPSWTEELVMRVLCSGAGGSVAEIYDSVGAEGLTVGAVYKVAERLKARGFVYPSRYFRVNDRGPMREMLSADCRNCFYGFTSQDMCLQETLAQLDGLMRRDFGKSPTREERSALYASMKTMPYSSRVNRKVLASLRLMHEVDRMTREGRVSGILRKIEENYGVELPAKTPS